MATGAQPQDHSVLLQAEQAVARVLAQASRQQRAYRRVLETIGVTLDWELGAVWEISDDAMLRCAVRWRTDGVDGEGLENAMRGLVLARGQDLPGRVWKTGRPAATQRRCSYARRLSHKCPAMRIASERWEARC